MTHLLPYRLWATAVALSVSLGLTHSASGASDTLPSPSLVFNPDATSAFYFDLEGASQSSVWKAMESRLRSLPTVMSQLENRRQAPPAFLSFLAGIQRLDAPLQGLDTLDLAEIAIVGEGTVSSTDPSQMDENAGFVALARLTQPLTDRDAFVRQVLGWFDEARPGLSGQILATRSQAGPAEFFDIPTEALGGLEMPFTLSLAIGPASQGTLVALGRTDRLKTFLEGKTTGQVPPALADLLPTRGQLWMYSAIPANASQTLAAVEPWGGGGNNPGQMLEALDQLREVGLNVSFGASSIDLQVLVGCRNAETATQMAQGLQMALALGGAQAWPGLAARTKATATGPVFKLSTAVTPGDYDFVVQAVGGSTSSVGTGAAKVVVEPLPEGPPVAVEFLEFLPSQNSHLRRAKLRIENTSTKAVSEVRLTYEYRGGRRQKLGEYTKQQRDPLSEILVGASTSRTIEWTLFSVPLATEVVQIRVSEVVFRDGSKWTEAN